MKSVVRFLVSLFAALVSLASIGRASAPVPSGPVVYHPDFLIIQGTQAQTTTGYSYTLQIDAPSVILTDYPMSVDIGIAINGTPPTGFFGNMLDFIRVTDINDVNGTRSVPAGTTPRVTFGSPSTPVILTVLVKIPTDVLPDGADPVTFSWKIKPISWPILMVDAGHVVNGTAQSKPLPTVPPLVTTNPSDVTIYSGQSASFSVVATGSGPLSYSWRRNGTPIDAQANPSAVTATLNLTNVPTAAAGTYSVFITNTAGNVTSAGAVLTVLRRAATVTATNATVTFDGTVKSIPAPVTNPLGLSVGISYSNPTYGTTSAPVNAGVYAANVTITDSEYTGSTTATLTINKAPQTLGFNPMPPSVVTVGAANFNLNAVSTTTATVASGIPLTYSSNNTSVATVSASGVVTVGVAGNATITVNQAGNDNFLAATAISFPLVVNKITPTIVWGPIADIVSGTALSSTQLNATAVYNNQTVAGTLTYTPAAGTVLPVGSNSLSVTFTPTDTARYNSATGRNTVNVTSASGCGTAIVRHAPVINGNAGVQGSLQMLLGENVALNGNAFISESFFVPGLAELRTTGHPVYGTTIVGSGLSTPSGYTVTLHGNAVLGHLVTRTNPVSIPVVSAPTIYPGTRDVKIDDASDTLGTTATIRDLSLSGKAGQVSLPPGNYRDIKVTGSGNVLVLGNRNGSPATYTAHDLEFSGDTTLKVISPVTINVSGDAKFSGLAGTEGHSELLTVNLSTGDLTLTGQAELHGSVVASVGEVTVNGQAKFCGGLQADQLRLDGWGLVDLCDCGCRH